MTNYMKTLVTTFFLLFISNLFSQNIYKKFLYDTGTFQSTREFVENYIDNVDRLTERKNDKKIKEFVKTNFDYSEHEKNQYKLIKKYYSKKEIEEIYNLEENQNKIFPKDKIYYVPKNQVEKSLYNLGYEMGAKLYDLIEYILGESVTLNISKKKSFSILDIEGGWAQLSLKHSLHFRKGRKNQFLTILPVKSLGTPVDSPLKVDFTKFYFSKKKEKWNEKSYIRREVYIKSKKIYLITEKSGYIEVINYIEKPINLKERGKKILYKILLSWSDGKYVEEFWNYKKVD